MEILEQQTGRLADTAVACQRKSFQLSYDIDFYITSLNTVLIIMTLEGKLIIHAQNNSAFGTCVRSDINPYPIIHTYTTAFKTQTSHEHSSLKLINLSHYIEKVKKKSCSCIRDSNKNYYYYYSC